MSITETAPEHLLADLDQISRSSQLRILEAMHRRVITIGNEREAATPLIEGAPDPGPLGGQFAKLRRTRVRATLFYETHVDGIPMEGMCTVPLLPLDEFQLMGKINDLGHSILQLMSPEEKQQTSIDRLLKYPLI